MSYFSEYFGVDEAQAAADQLATDIAAVDAAKADIKNTRTLLTVTGTLDVTADNPALAVGGESGFRF